MAKLDRSGDSEHLCSLGGATNELARSRPERFDKYGPVLGGNSTLCPTLAFPPQKVSIVIGLKVVNPNLMSTRVPTFRCPRIRRNFVWRPRVGEAILPVMAGTLSFAIAFALVRFLAFFRKH